MNNKNYTKMHGAYVLMLFLFITHIFSGFSSAPPTGRTGAPGDGMCTDCHGGNNPLGFDGSLQISGLPAEVTPNTTYRVTVEVANPNGLSQRAGMQMVALKSDDTAAGTFTNPSAGGAVIVDFSNGRNYLGHAPAQLYDPNRVVTWEVDWTTPAEVDPNVTFYAVGNIANGSGTFGDLILFETENTQIIEPAMELPDLFASNVMGFGGTFAPDEVAEFTWDLNNNSNVVATETYRIAMFLSDDDTFSADDPLVGEVPTGNTFPGVIPSVPGAIRIPLDAADGEYYLHFVVDADGVIEESDEDNNLLTTSTTITVMTPITESLTVSLTSMFFCDEPFALSTIVNGGVAPYTYIWSTGDTGPSTGAIITDTYSVTVTDDVGTQVVEDLFVIVPDTLSAEVVINEQPACGGFGSVSIIPISDFLPIVVEWQDGFVGEDRDDLVPGTYAPIVTDGSGCTLVLDVVLDADSDITLAVTVTQLTCPDVDDASIALVASGGSGNYTYSWSNQETTSSIIGLPAGIYTVTVNDGGSCETVQSFVITMLQPIELVSTVTEITCAADEDGAISVLAIGGTGPYQYIWSNNVTTNNNTDLAAGTYTVTVIDNNNCLYSEDFEIGEVPAIDVDIFSNNVTCFGGMDGGYVAQIVGEPSTVQTMEGLVAGAYEITLTNSMGCSVVQAIVISEPAQISTSEELEDVLCFNEASGSISILQVLGGVPPFRYDWSNGLSSSTIVGLVAGSYEVTITDAQDCSFVQDFTISEPDELILTGETVLQTGNNSAIDIEVAGGVVPYTYQWSNGETTQDIANLPEGDYDVIVTDGNGCMLVDNFNIIFTSVQTIEELTSLNLYPTPTQDVLNVDVSFSNAVDISAQVFSLDGRYQERINTDFSKRAGGLTSQIDVGHLDAGIYMLVLKSEEGVVAKRFVKL